MVDFVTIKVLKIDSLEILQEEQKKTTCLLYIYVMIKNKLAKLTEIL